MVISVGRVKALAVAMMARALTLGTGPPRMPKRVRMSVTVAMAMAMTVGARRARQGVGSHRAFGRWVMLAAATPEGKVEPMRLDVGLYQFLIGTCARRSAAGAG